MTYYFQTSNQMIIRHSKVYPAYITETQKQIFSDDIKINIVFVVSLFAAFT